MLGFIIWISEDFTASVSSGLSVEHVHQIQIFPDEQQQSRATTPKWHQRSSLYNQQEALHLLMTINILKCGRSNTTEVSVPPLSLQGSNLRPQQDQATRQAFLAMLYLLGWHYHEPVLPISLHLIVASPPPKWANTTPEQKSLCDRHSLALTPQ